MSEPIAAGHKDQGSGELKSKDGRRHSSRAAPSVRRDGGAAGLVSGWITSLLLHGVILLVAALVYFGKEAEEDDNAHFSTIRRPDAPKVDTLAEPPEKKKKDDAVADIPIDVAVQDPGSMEKSQDVDAGSGLDGSDAGSISGGAAFSTLGVGGTGGRGTYGKPRASGPRAPKKATDKHLKEALCWLARHQNADGSWSAVDFSKNCGRHGYSESCSRNEFSGNEQYDVGVTALALLALLGGGYTPQNRELVYSTESEVPAALSLVADERSFTYGESVKRACKYLLSAQDSSGRIGPAVDRYVYNHMLSTLALCEAYGNTRIWRLRKPTEKAVRFLLESQSPRGGWRYSPRSPDSDSCVTGWAYLALKSAETASIPLDRSVFDAIRKWFDQVTVKTTIPEASMGDLSWDTHRPFLLTGYLGPRDAGRLVSVSGMNEHYTFTPGLTAAMVEAHGRNDTSSSTKASEAIDTLLAFLPAPWSPDDKASWRKVDFHYWFHGTYALSRVTAADDPRWKRWMEALVESVFKTENLKGFGGNCAEGSWEPIDRWSCEGGRVYMTAVGALILEAYFRFPRVLALEKQERPILTDG